MRKRINHPLSFDGVTSCDDWKALARGDMCYAVICSLDPHDPPGVGA